MSSRKHQAAMDTTTPTIAAIASNTMNPWLRRVEVESSSAVGGLPSLFAWVGSSAIARQATLQHRPGASSRPGDDLRRSGQWRDDGGWGRIRVGRPATLHAHNLVGAHGA